MGGEKHLGPNRYDGGYGSDWATAMAVDSSGNVIVTGYSWIAAGVDDKKILLVNEALEKLAIEDPLRAEVVKLHYFVGLTHAESAEILQISEKTVRRHWNFARVWLYQSIQSAVQPNAPHSGNQTDAPAE